MSKDPSILFRTYFLNKWNPGFTKHPGSTKIFGFLPTYFSASLKASLNVFVGMHLIPLAYPGLRAPGINMADVCFKAIVPQVTMEKA